MEISRQHGNRQTNGTPMWSYFIHRPVPCMVVKRRPSGSSASVPSVRIYDGGGVPAC